MGQFPKVSDPAVGYPVIAAVISSHAVSILICKLANNWVELPAYFSLSICVIEIYASRAFQKDASSQPAGSLLCFFMSHHLNMLFMCQETLKADPPQVLAFACPWLIPQSDTNMMN